jgi:hypothetical protein
MSEEFLDDNEEEVFDNGPDDVVDELEDRDLDGEDAVDDDSGEDTVLLDGADKAPVRKPSRASQRIQTLAKELAEVKARAEAAERRAAEAAQPRGPSAQELADERARFEMMTPEQQDVYLARKEVQNTNARMAQLERTMMDSSDRAAFQAKASRDPRLAAYEDRVEVELAKVRASGANAPRETIAYFLIGKDVASKSPAAKKKQAAAAGQRVAAQTGRVVSGRGDTAAGRRGRSLEDRLDGVLI